MSYDKRYIPSYNDFIAVNKTLSSRISPEEWNTLWNVISVQLDDVALQLKMLHDFLTGGGTVSELLSLPAGTSNILEAAKVLGKIPMSTTEPTDDSSYWFKIISQN